MKVEEQGRELWPQAGPAETSESASTVVLKVWTPDHHHYHHLGTLMNAHSQAQQSVLTRPSGDFDANQYVSYSVVRENVKGCFSI